MADPKHAAATPSVLYVAPGQRFHTLDGFRGVAAIVVMLFHFAGLARPRFLMHGFLAVDLFFILSGFVICHAYTAKMLAGLTPGQFLNRRLARLIPTAACGVALGAGAILALYDVNDPDFSFLNFALVHAGHIALLPAQLDYEIPARSPLLLFPSNPPMWSIFFELLASLGFIWFVYWRKWGLLVGWLAFSGLLVVCAIHMAHVSGGAVSANLGWNQENFIGGFPRAIASFLCGMLLYRLTGGRQSLQLSRIGPVGNTVAVLALYLMACGLLLIPFYARGAYQFAAILVLFPALIAAGSLIPVRAGWLVAVSGFLGELSFPLYAVHEPVHMLTDIFLHRSGLPALPFAVTFALKVPLALGTAYLLMELLALFQAGPRLSRALKPITG